MFLQRSAESEVRDLLGVFRVVLLRGARQTGKTTLARGLMKPTGENWFSLDDSATVEKAATDPVGFIQQLPRPVIIDEFQRAGPGLLLAVKQAVDEDRARGQFLLTGSTSYLANNSVTETLAGRVGAVLLRPLSMGERLGLRENFLDEAFTVDRRPPHVSMIPRDELAELVLTGGYPEIVTEELGGRARRAWFEAYVEQVVSREALRPLAEVRLEAELRTLFRLVAARSAQEVVVADLGADAGTGRHTAANHLTLLEALHLVWFLPAWSTSATTRVKRRSKAMLVDSGLAAEVSGGTSAFGPRADGVYAGALFETFVVNELAKQATWCERQVNLAHFRDRNGPEVDLVVEDRQTGHVVCIEVKLTSTPRQHDARHLALLRDRLGDRFRAGFVVHAGPQTLPFGERISAIPVTALWERW